MRDNLYKTPESPLTENNEEKGSSIKAIIYGAIFDITGSLILGFMFIIIYTIYMTSKGMPLEGIQNSFQSMDKSSPVSILGMVLGTFISFCAGYVCARKSITRIYRDAFIVGIISSIFGMFAGGASVYSSIELLFLSAMTIMAVLMGAAVWNKRRV